MDMMYLIKIAVLITAAITPVALFFYLLTRAGRPQFGYTYKGSGDGSRSTGPMNVGFDSGSSGGYDCSSGSFSGDGGSCGGGDSGGGGGST